MKIWLIKIAEPDPIEGTQLGRTGELAEYLSRNGHDVTWWKSTFHHGTKTLKYSKDTIKKYGDNEKVISLHSPVIYKKNISLKRILFYFILSIKFSKMAAKNEKPDIILSSWPSIFITYAAVKYGKKNKIPVVIDVRDYWPDIFEKSMPKPLAKILMKPLKYETGKIFKSASGITAVQNTALKWGCRYAARVPSNYDRAFFIGIRRFELTGDKREELLEWWKNKGVTANTWNICFWGSLKHSGLDLSTVIKAVVRLEKKYPSIRLIIGGEGDSREYLEKIAGNSSAIIFAGYCNGYQMSTAMSISKVGVYSLINSEDFIDTVSNKAIQYMSGSLPVLNSLTGYMNKLLSEENAGLSYKEGDVKDCISKIEYFYTHENERALMANNASKLYTEMFFPDKINKEFETYLNHIIDSYSIYNNTKKTNVKGKK